MSSCSLSLSPMPSFLLGHPPFSADSRTINLAIKPDIGQRTMMDSASPEMLAKLTIYNMPPSPPNFDQVGRFFIAFGSTWTLLVFSGMIFCALNHKNPLIKIRCIPLSFGAILMLHSYWILAQITYSVGRTMPVVLAYDIQYFFMGIYYPLGMALFHASNLRFLHVAKLQKQFTNPEPRVRGGCNGSKSSILCRIRNLSYTVRIMLFIGIGMIFQVCRIPATSIGREAPTWLADICCADSPHSCHVVCLQKVPSHLWTPGDRDQGSFLARATG